MDKLSGLRLRLDHGTYLHFTKSFMTRKGQMEITMKVQSSKTEFELSSYLKMFRRNCMWLLHNMPLNLKPLMKTFHAPEVVERHCNMSSKFNKFSPEKVPEKMPGECCWTLSMKAPDRGGHWWWWWEWGDVGDDGGDVGDGGGVMGSGCGWGCGCRPW